MGSIIPTLSGGAILLYPTIKINYSSS